MDIYTAGGTKVAHYAYDAWGNHTVTHYNGSTVGNINPFRYRGYYFDAETGFYYLQSRYYDSTTGRFLNADAISYLGSTGGFRSYNLYTYCGNNPVMYTDPTGHEFQWWNPSTWDWDSDWEEILPVATDLFFGALALAAGITVGIVVGAKTKSWGAGVLAGVATTGLINNVVNFVYYTWFADDHAPLADFKIDGIDYSPYANRYITRWDRLDHTKTKLREAGYDTSWYTPWAWMYYSEYNAHMLGWYANQALEAMGIDWLSGITNHVQKADVDVGKPWNNHPVTILFTGICMLLGW